MKKNWRYEAITVFKHFSSVHLLKYFCVDRTDFTTFYLSALFQEVFSTCPSMPWGEDVITSVERNTNGWITLQGFLAQWT